jgi:S-adenosylmethionine:tRNA ribosyltransferase-isomerase
MHPKEISILDYTYDLPEERIADFPIAERQDAKLLIYQKGVLQEDQYKNIANYLPENSLLVFNDTRVIQARLLFKKASGASIEIFCLEPYDTINEYNVLMAKKESIQWKCLIGGANKWKEGNIIKEVFVQGEKVALEAQLIEKITDAYIVKFSWNPAQLSFAEIIEQAGDTPLPPYIKRKPIDSDKERYQTIYAKQDGSVAAPTAGLHFTPSIFSSLAAKNIPTAFVTLHVGAGTFKPVKADLLKDHPMHAEWIDVSAETILQLIENFNNGIIAVGTTALRTLESLFWMGVKASLNPNAQLAELMIHQWDVYEAPLSNCSLNTPAALEALVEWMKKNKYDRILSPTQILIAPGYRYQVVKAIVTNFHQPQSTLLLLVAAAIGKDWKKVYQFALENDYRFLSYGDGSLLFLNSKDEMTSF